ncbi:hypothetical protein, partial [Escherichia coli]
MSKTERNLYILIALIIFFNVIAINASISIDWDVSKMNYWLGFLVSIVFFFDLYIWPILFYP